MVGVGQNGPRRDNRIPSANQQEDFYFWLRRMPIGFLQELYKRYREKIRSPSFKPSSFPQASISELTDKDQTGQKKEKIILRRSVFLLITTLVSIEIFFDLIYIALRIPPLLFTISLTSQINFTSLYFTIFVLLNVIKIIFMVAATLQWITHLYEIRIGEIRYTFGILKHSEKIFMCSYTQEVMYTQGILGRVFNFGTIEVYNPTIKERIYLEDIPNPNKYADVIKDLLPSPQEAGYMPIDI